MNDKEYAEAVSKLQARPESEWEELTDSSLYPLWPEADQENKTISHESSSEPNTLPRSIIHSPSKHIQFISHRLKTPTLQGVKKAVAWFPSLAFAPGKVNVSIKPSRWYAATASAHSFRIWGYKVYRTVNPKNAIKVEIDVKVDGPSAGMESFFLDLVIQEE